MGMIVAAALGECVHVAGISNYLRLAQDCGWNTRFLGPAVSIETVLQAAREENAEIVGVSYRLTPETGERLLAEFAEAADDLRAQGVKFLFAGTPPLAERARAIGFFEQVYEGGEPADKLLAYLRGGNFDRASEQAYPQNALERIAQKAPYPIIRHHFGLPTMESTKSGIHRIAEARVLDVISLGTDQDAQENFFHPERQIPRRFGAGGVPVRSADDYRALYAASRAGNYPLLRTYSGSDDFIRLAEMFVETIRNAWCAIPLFWFNRMDGRGPWDLKGSIREHQRLIAWYGERGIPVELNEPHHWGMRDASDVTFVVAGYLSAYSARAFGVQDYIAQLMFNTPPGLSDAMDLAKMLAVLDLIQPLAGPEFRIWKQTRTGLLSYPLDPDAARGHLAASVYVQMALRPHILHVVGHTEAHHAATADDIIEDVQIARRPVENAIRGQADMSTDPAVNARREELSTQARIMLEAIRKLGSPEVEDALVDAETLANAVTSGILDAPQLRNNAYALGKTTTRIDSRGACIAIAAVNGRPISEEQRLESLGVRF